MLHPGLISTQTMLVTPDKTAAAVGSGRLPVLATPAMVALMEKTASESVEPFLNDGETTVGISLDVQHLAATPEGMVVHCDSELVYLDRKKLVFQVSVFDGSGLVGTGVHKRFIVDATAFLAKVNAKKQPAEICSESPPVPNFHVESTLAQDAAAPEQIVESAGSAQGSEEETAAPEQTVECAGSAQSSAESPLRRNKAARMLEVLRVLRKKPPRRNKSSKMSGFLKILRRLSHTESEPISNSKKARQKSEKGGRVQ